MRDDAKDPAGEDIVLDSSFMDPYSPWKMSSDGDDLFNPDLDPVLVVLNHNLPRLTAVLWRRARLVLVADGGADRLLEASKGWEEDFGSTSISSSWRRPPLRRSDGDEDGKGKPSSPSPFLPDFILGDLDSISASARLHYGSLGVPIVDLSADQDSTDLQKCLAFAAAEVEKQKEQRGLLSTSTSTSTSPLPPPVFVAGALGGRLDHSLSALSTLYAIDAARRKRKESGNEEEQEEGFAAAAARSLGDVVLAGDGSLARLIPSSSSSSASSSSSSTTTIILSCAAVEGPGCGLVALGSSARGVETSGLEWNLSAKKGEKDESPPLEMGGLQSTSNSIIEGNKVTVRSSAPLLWTTTLREEWR